MSIVDQLTKNVKQAREVAESNPAQAIKLLEGVIHQKVETEIMLERDACIKAKENATYDLAKLFRDKGLVEQLIDLQKLILPLFKDFPKSKLARISRQLFD